MIIREMCLKQGNWMFRHRSYLPLSLVILIVIAAFNAGFFECDSVPAQAWEVLAIVVSSIGFLIRIITIGIVPQRTSGRNVLKQVADTLNTTGIYSLCRHPLYLGNFFMHYGIIMLTRSLWLILIYPFLYWVYYERIMLAEEDFLIGKFGDTYLKWAEKTSAVIPQFKNWQPSKLPFSIKAVLRREYSGFFAMVFSLAIVKHLTFFARTGHFEWHFNWLITVGVAGILYLTLRTLKRKTRILHEAGR